MLVAMRYLIGNVMLIILFVMMVMRRVIRFVRVQWIAHTTYSFRKCVIARVEKFRVFLGLSRPKAISPMAMRLLRRPVLLHRINQIHKSLLHCAQLFRRKLTHQFSHLLALHP